MFGPIMARSTVSIVWRCAVLLLVIVEVTTQPPPVRDDRQENYTEVESQPASPHCGDESLVLEVLEVRGQVQLSLDRLADIEDTLKLVIDEREIIQRSLDKLAGIEARLTDVNECASNPCAADAVCSDRVDGYTCICDGTVTHRHCKDVRNAMCSVSGVYTVTPRGGIPTQVYCDMDTAGGGWLVFQKRVDGSVDFDMNWESYAAGFGDLNGEFWLGNRNLHMLTAQTHYTLRLELSDWEGNQTYVQYNRFTIDSERDKFRLGLAGYSGDAGPSLTSVSGMPFSARDVDNDLHRAHCAQVTRGAWWFRSCSSSNLNGHYYPGGPYTRAQTPSGWEDGVRWDHWMGKWYSLKTTRMMMSPTP